jgi:hypothetical protein
MRRDIVCEWKALITCIINTMWSLHSYQSRASMRLYVYQNSRFVATTKCSLPVQKVQAITVELCVTLLILRVFKVTRLDTV